MTRLAAAVKATYEEGQLDIYADALEDMRPRSLELAFTHLERTHTIAALPAPGEIRELGDHLRSEEYRKEHENDLSNQMAQAKAEAEANPLTDEDRAEIKTAYSHTVERMAARARALQEFQQEERRKNHYLLLGIEFYLELRRVKRHRDAAAKAAL